jgi:arsenite methyltransferase
MSDVTPEPMTHELVKSCCANLYASDWARLLLGESFHPGGMRLTDRLAELLGIDAGMRVLDVAAGLGTSAIHLASRHSCHVVGVDLSADNMMEATERALRAGVADRVTFVVGDAESLELPGGSFDAVICECSFCTFPDKRASSRGFARALRPGGRVGISDLTRLGDVPTELEGLLAWVACIGDALPLDEYVAQLWNAGLHIDCVEPHDEALAEMVEDVRDKLLGARFLVELGRLSLPGIDLDAARAMARSALSAVRDGRLGYAIVCASKPALGEEPV